MRSSLLRTFATLLCLTLVTSLGCSSSSDDDSGDDSGGRTVLVSGSGTWGIPLGRFADFDTGSIYGPSPQAGMDLHYDTGWEYIHAYSYLVGDTGARMVNLGVVDFGAVTWEQVGAASMVNILRDVPSLPAGTVLGYKTSEGRYGKIKFISLGSAPYPKSWAVSFVTWQ